MVPGTIPRDSMIRIFSRQVSVTRQSEQRANEYQNFERFSKLPNPPVVVIQIAYCKLFIQVFV